MQTITQAVKELLTSEKPAESPLQVGEAKLRAYTQHPEMTPEEFIAYCARVSNPGNQYTHETSDRLLSYLLRNSHWSPFEMAHATIEIVTTRDIARQILRHRSFAFQEFSQRYADPTQLGFHNREARLQDNKNRQNSVKTDDEKLKNDFNYDQELLIKLARDTYGRAISAGIAKEQARAFLPEGLTISRLYMSGTIRSWIHYCQLREANGTQLEHQEVAQACRQALAPVFPILFGSTNENTN